MEAAPELNSEASLPSVEVMLTQLQQIVENFQADQGCNPEMVQRHEENVEKKVQEETDSLEAATTVESPLESRNDQLANRALVEVATSDQDSPSLRPLPLRSPLRSIPNSRQNHLPQYMSSPRRSIQERRAQSEYIGQSTPSLFCVKNQDRLLFAPDSDEDNASPQQIKLQGCNPQLPGSPDENGLSDNQNMIGDGLVSASEEYSGVSEAEGFEFSYPERRSSLRRPPQPYCKQCYHPTASGLQSFTGTPSREIEVYHKAIRDIQPQNITPRSLQTLNESFTTPGLQPGHRRTHATHRAISEKPNSSLPGDPFSTTSTLKEDVGEIPNDEALQGGYTDTTTCDDTSSLGLSSLSSGSTADITRLMKIQTGSRETIKPLSIAGRSMSHSKIATSTSKLSIGRKKRHSISSTGIFFGRNISPMSSSASSVCISDNSSPSPQSASSPRAPPFPKPRKNRVGLSAMAAGLGGGYNPESSPLTSTSPYSFKTPTGRELCMRRTPTSGSITRASSSTSLPLSTIAEPPPPYTSSNVSNVKALDLAHDYSDEANMTASEKAIAHQGLQIRLPVDQTKKSIVNSDRLIATVSEHQRSDAIRKAKSKFSLRNKSGAGKSSRRLSVSEQQQVRLSLQTCMRKARKKFLNDTGEASNKPLIPESRAGPDFSLPSPPTPPPMSVEAVKAGLPSPAGLSVSSPEPSSHTVKFGDELPIIDTSQTVRLRPHEIVSPFQNRGTLKQRRIVKENAAENLGILPEEAGETPPDWEHPAYRKDPFKPWSPDNSVFTKEELTDKGKIGRAPVGNAFAQKRE